MVARQRLPFPRVHKQDIIFDSPRERKIRCVLLAGRRIAVVAGDDNPRGVLFRHRKLRERSKLHASPVVVEPAPRRDAMEVADVLDLRQVHELLPRQREWILNEADDLQLPILERDIRRFAEAEHRPVGHRVLIDRH